MDMIPVPEIVTQQISRRAVEIAQIIGPRKSGKGLSVIQPYWEEGLIGIQVPDDKKYLLDLDEGIREHPMSSLEGRIIPVRSPGGSLYLRRATEENIGQTPIISRASDSGKISDGKPEWVYPSKEGLNFIQRSLQQSVDEWARSVRSKNVIDMLLQTRVKNDVSMVIYGREIA
jgi:hypothetical protein